MTEGLPLPQLAFTVTADTQATARFSMAGDGDQDGLANWFEDAYFLFSVHLFDASIVRRKANPKKIYCVDHALVTSVTPGILVNSGHLLENLVFTALRRVSPDIYYFRTRGGLEVDFVGAGD